MVTNILTFAQFLGKAEMIWNSLSRPYPANPHHISHIAHLSLVTNTQISAGIKHQLTPLLKVWPPKIWKGKSILPLSSPSLPLLTQVADSRCFLWINSGFHQPSPPLIKLEKAAESQPSKSKQTWIAFLPLSAETNDEFQGCRKGEGKTTQLAAAGRWAGSEGERATRSFSGGRKLLWDQLCCLGNYSLRNHSRLPWRFETARLSWLSLHFPTRLIRFVNKMQAQTKATEADR